MRKDAHKTLTLTSELQDLQTAWSRRGSNPRPMAVSASRDRVARCFRGDFFVSINPQTDCETNNIELVSQPGCNQQEQYQTF
mmetsp:Transcript_62483/g.92872  ORF Transcript_62483/g.92872 Transcript_62483/m.92872 type:complete len:82 (+) Transcript_62483:686-931(+)